MSGLSAMYFQRDAAAGDAKPIKRKIKISNGGESVPEEQMKEVVRFQESIKTIRDMFMRDTMKVVFFGRTSNGKSSVINAMLHAKVLPQGMGHTTCCFLQVEGSTDDEKFILWEGSEKRVEIEKLQKLGHAMSDSNASLSSMGQDSLLRVFYPKSTSKLLQNDVVIVDSPGVDLSPEFDSWIDKHCLDADVFVLVCNAESTLTQAEKSFFYRVSSKLSKPNIFILNNRWDASAAEAENSQQIREQHMNRFKQFLVDELEVCSESEALNRVFFISAREMLDYRLKERGVIVHGKFMTHNNILAYQVEGFQYRAQEFINFESQFERIISKSAISTKFEAHQLRAREIAAAMQANLDLVRSTSLKRKEKLLIDHNNKDTAFKACVANWRQAMQKALLETHQLIDEVLGKLSTNFEEEIRRIDSIIDRFEGKFIDDPKMICEYKKSLAEFVDKIVTDDLETRCTGSLVQRIWSLENNIYQSVFKILDEPYTKKLEQIWRYRTPFSLSICLNCASLMQDFREDLEFRFSLGVTALVRRFTAYRLGKPITAIASQPLADVIRSYGTPTNENEGDFASSIQRNKSQDELQMETQESALLAQVVMSSIGYLANGSIGIFLIGGLVTKSIGWRVIAAGAAAYGGLYALEYWRWNSGAKEQHLRDQFRAHLSARMQGVASTHVLHCKSQILREVKQLIESLKGTVKDVHHEMESELSDIKNQIRKIDSACVGLDAIKQKTSSLNGSLNQFENEFLKNGAQRS